MKLDKLLRFVSGNPMYKVNLLEDTVELIAITPSIGEAASDTEAQPTESRRMIVLFKLSQDNEVIPIEAYVEEGDKRRPLSIDEIRWWLDVLETMIG